MPTLHRILKYTPAVVLGLLVVAWVVSWFCQFGIIKGAGRFPRFQVTFVGGSLHTVIGDTFIEPRVFLIAPRYWDFELRNLIGSLRFDDRTPVHVAVEIPMGVILTALTPLALSPFLSFRFRLWHYLAYSALVAVELAYYLRWQE
jgi:hypothetical protein